MDTQSPAPPDDRSSGSFPGAGHGSPPALPWLLLLAARGAFFAALWLALVEGAIETYVYGVPLALLTAAVSLQLHPSIGTRIRLLKFLAFVPRFWWKVVLGGWDAARRALDPTLPISPDILHHPMTQPTDPVGIALGYAISLQPGTITVDFMSDGLRIHAMDVTAPVLRSSDEMQRRLSAFIIGPAQPDRENADV